MDLIGHVRTTKFGAIFDVLSAPDSNDLADRSIALGARTDNPCREPVGRQSLRHGPADTTRPTRAAVSLAA